jgi:hypothetical protein
MLVQMGLIGFLQVMISPFVFPVTAETFNFVSHLLRMAR